MTPNRRRPVDLRRWSVRAAAVIAVALIGVSMSTYLGNYRVPGEH